MRLPFLTIFSTGVFAFLASCSSHQEQKLPPLGEEIFFEDGAATDYFSQTITTHELRTHIYALTDPIMEGRATGSHGYTLAANYVKEYYQNQSLEAPSPAGHFQTLPKDYFNDTVPETHNVVAYIPGSTLPEEVLIISAHLDHLGKVGDQIYPGADDNASGTAAVMEIAQAFMMAKENGYGPKRSLLFLHLTAEEIGLYGSRYYVENPLFPLKNTVANLNIDMIGRVDSRYAQKTNKNYIYLIGADRLSSELHHISEATNKRWGKLTLDYTYNQESDPNKFYYRSDHYNFAAHNIPIIFYFNGTHEDYHRPTDTADKIDFNLLQKRAQLVFGTAWYLANAPERLKLD